jgi:hypothetical protein
MAGRAGAPLLDIEVPEEERHALLWSTPPGSQRRAAWRLVAGSVAALLILSAVAAFAPAVWTGAPKCAEKSCRSISHSLDTTVVLKKKETPVSTPSPPSASESGAIASDIDEKLSPPPMSTTEAGKTGASATSPGEEVTTTDVFPIGVATTTVMDEKPSPAPNDTIEVETTGASTTSPGEEATTIYTGTIEVATTTVMDEKLSPAPNDTTEMETIGASTTLPEEEVATTKMKTHRHRHG